MLRRLMSGLAWATIAVWLAPALQAALDFGVPGPPKLLLQRRGGGSQPVA